MTLQIALRSCYQEGFRPRILLLLAVSGQGFGGNADGRVMATRFHPGDKLRRRQAVEMCGTVQN
jgi:hypothetical protein